MTDAVSDILKWAADRMGGQPLIDELHSIHTTAHVTAPTREFETDVYSAADGRVRFEQRSGEERFVTAGINHDQAWHQGATITALDASARFFVRGHEYHMLVLQPLSRLENPRVEPQTTFAGRAANVIAFQDILDEPFRIYYDAVNGRPLGMQHSTGDGQMARVELSDWQPVGRYVLFTRAQIDHGGQIYDYQFHTLVLNSAIDQLFEPNLDEQLAQLLALHEEQRKAHLNGDSRLLTSRFAESLINISNGRITSAGRAELESNFARYFAQVHFDAWENISPPQITLSDDRSLANILVHKRVRLRRADDPSAPIRETIFAWLEQWQMRAQQWSLTAICSTDRPADG